MNNPFRVIGFLAVAIITVAALFSAVTGSWLMYDGYWFGAAFVISGLATLIGTVHVLVRMLLSNASNRSNWKPALSQRKKERPPILYETDKAA